MLNIVSLKITRKMGRLRVPEVSAHNTYLVEELGCPAHILEVTLHSYA